MLSTPVGNMWKALGSGGQQVVQHNMLRGSSTHSELRVRLVVRCHTGWDVGRRGAAGWDVDVRMGPQV